MTSQCLNCSFNSVHLTRDFCVSKKECASKIKAEGVRLSTDAGTDWSRCRE